jgi:SAM-dependent methyltransferase
MTRTEMILAGITKDMRGIEIAPWFAPLAPKSGGFDCLTLDIFDRAELVSRAIADPNIPKDSIGLISDVDFVGSAIDIEKLVPQQLHGTFDYIVSSHNFEHLPDPIKFLQGCQRILRPGGRLSMAIPDSRACFDFFRPHTTIGDWLEAYHGGRTKPSRGSLFEGQAYSARLFEGDVSQIAFSIEANPHCVYIVGDLAAAYATWMNASNNDPYTDAHCSVMTPASFQLLIEECRYLGLISFRCESVSASIGCEFHVLLVNDEEKGVPDDFNKMRTHLAREIWKERSELMHATFGAAQSSSEIRRSTHKVSPAKKAFRYRITQRLSKIMKTLIRAFE